MDEENLKASILTYKQQLQQVETVLLSAGTDGQTELFQLKEDLQEVIQLTEESLLSLTKSKLLSLVDTATETNSLRVTMGSLDASSSGPSLGNDAFSDFDKEFALFQAAIADDDAYYTTQSAVSASTSSGPSSTTCQDVMRRAEARDDAENANEEDDISGTKCSVFHMEEWGRRQRHNAVVMSVEPRADSGDEASLRVLFCNPTTTSMKPCPYYLEGSCRFSVEDCRFSHGYVVKLSELHSFKEPDFSLLKLEAPCLARYSDGVWYPATIQHIDEDQHQVTVQYESYGTTATLDVESVLPSDQQDDPSPNLSSSSDDDDNDDNDESNESNFPSSSSRRDTPTPEEEEDVPCVAWRPSGDGVPLGEWEAHTRGIGSKLMALMGYEFGKSLDKCMELREMKKLGIVGKQKKKKRKSKGQHHHGNGSSSLGGEPRKKESIFDFLNKKLGGKKTKIAELIQQNMDNRMFLEKDSTTMNKEEGNTSRTLNIQLVNTQEDIRNTERRLIRLQESLQRNQSDKLTASQIQAKITGVEQQLDNFKSTERKIQRQQNTRQQHRKLTIF